MDGAPPSEAGRIEAALGRDPRDRKKMGVVPEAQGRAAITEYTVRERFRAHTLLVCRLLTGRTHQLRVHLAYLRCPIAGDRVYGRRTASVPIGRQCLHAWQLPLRLPGTGALRTFTAPVPPDIEQVLALLRK